MTEPAESVVGMPTTEAGRALAFDPQDAVEGHGGWTEVALAIEQQAVAAFLESEDAERRLAAVLGTLRERGFRMDRPARLTRAILEELRKP